MMHTWFLLTFVAGLVFCIEHDFKGFDDSILFGINWPGAEDSINNLVDGDTKEEPTNQSKEVVKILTSNKEAYECQIPEVKDNEPIVIADYEGPSPLQLLNPLFSQKICSYRLESYWSYEVCHGRYIRQYHEEREGKQIKTQEYYLGHWNPEKHKELEASLTAAKEKQEKPKTTKVDGIILPYVEMVMEDGTPCELSDKRRLTRIRYVCYSHGKHEIYSYKETITCEYEVIVLSPFLCDHPQFRPKDTSENVINCRPLDGAPMKPRSMLAMEAEALRLQHQTVRLMDNEKDPKDVLAVLKVQKIEKDGETHLKFELHPLSEGIETDAVDKPKLADKSVPLLDVNDDSPVKAFLKGENCLNGGTGWWRYEFCYGGHVTQYHVDRSGERTSVLLGRFHERAHLDWIRENKAKAPKPVDPLRKSVSHFYSDGDICDKTGTPRQTEVKLKCLENSQHSAQVSLYLLEPRTCHYILGVESPLICDILPYADENGLINMAQQFDANKDEDKEDWGKKIVDKLGGD